MSRSEEERQPPGRPTTLALVHEGWSHLKLQRPLAAWASWQRALREDPSDPAARKALDRLESADELPAAARAVYRFQPPPRNDPERRARWDATLRDRPLDDLDAAASAFASLAAADPADTDARLNLALCLAWLGRNAEAIDELDRVVSLVAPADADRAADAWTLAEVLRFGAGAEPLADDLRFAWTLDWPGGEGPPSGLFDSWPNLVPVAMPTDPVTGTSQLDNGSVHEWLDRPPTGPGLPPGCGTPRADELPRVLASVVATPRLLRLSSPDPALFAALDDPTRCGLPRTLAGGRRENSPLPIAWGDAALGTFRFPSGLDPRERAELAREAVEHYYENLWIHRPRRAFGGRSPLEASAAVARGDADARARLAGVVRFREQLGGRLTHAAVYQGYPFDRLRRRLGLLAPDEAPALDADDLSCASAAELDQLDPDSLDDVRLADALASAAGLRDDARTARFAAALAGRDPAAWARARLDPGAIFAPLVRRSLRDGEPDQTLAWLDRARSVSTGPAARTFAVWSAEVLARTGNPTAAARIYRDLLDQPDADAALALDAGATLLDNGHPESALPFLQDARARAVSSGDGPTRAQADSLLRLADPGTG